MVVDTNVLISGAFFSGAPSLIIDACVNSQFTLVLSPDIIDEYQRVGEIFTKKQPNVPFQRFLGVLISKALIVEPIHIQSEICRDPDDQKFLECAISSNSKCLVSGDKDLLVIKEYKGLTIYSPRDFVDAFLS